jgi:hypothetical protein
MTQTEMILDTLLTSGAVTTYQAFTEFGVTRLAARIYDIKKQRPDLYIERKFCTITGRLGQTTSFAVYYLAGAVRCKHCNKFAAYSDECGYECQSCLYKMYTDKPCTAESVAEGMIERIMGKANR